MKKIFTQRGFTLAELLITLGIIGIICAMTIPALVNQVQDKQFKEAAKEAFSKASQAVQQMKLDEGGSLAYYYVTASSFKPIFMQYFKVVKDCLPLGDACVQATSISHIYSNLANGDANTSCMSFGQFITADGMFWGIYNYPAYTTARMMITVDVNGYGKKPNVFGKDVFVFELKNDGKDILTPMGGPSSYYPADTYCQRVDDGLKQGLGCMQNVMQGINY